MSAATNKLTNAPMTGCMNLQQPDVVVGIVTLSILRRSKTAPQKCGFSYSGPTLRTYGRTYRAAQAGCPLFRKARSVVIILYVRPPLHFHRWLPVSSNLGSPIMAKHTTNVSRRTFALGAIIASQPDMHPRWLTQWRKARSAINSAHNSRG